MDTLRVNNKDWLVGLEWEILPGDSTIKIESKEVAQKTALPYGIVVEYDATYAIGLTKKPKKGLKPAAVFLAAANQLFRESEELQDYPDWIVIEEAKDDRYWMSVIKSGIPAPQFDAILTLTEIKERITELLINDTYTIYSSSHEIINIFDGIKDIQNRSLNELTSEINIKYRFDKLIGIPPSVLVFGGIVSVIAIILGSVFTVLDGMNSSEKAAALKKRLANEDIQRRIQYENEKRDYDDKVKKIKQDKLNEIIIGLSGNPSEILSAFYLNVGDTPVGTHGWSLTEIECYFNVATKLPDGTLSEIPQAACDYIYKRNPLSTTRMFLEDYPDATLNGDVAKVQKVVKIDPKFIAKAPESILTTIRPAKEWGFNVLSQLQLLKVASIDNKIGASSDITYNIPGAPLTPEERKQGKQPNPQVNKKLDIGTGEVVVSGKNFDLVKELADNVDFTSTNLKKINYKVSSSNKLDWSATFTYYISTIDGDGVGSSSLTSESESNTKENGK